ncbi:MAG: S-layer homology domain-containing protein [Candidatus Margulisiibacteriota bacterium]
MKMKSRIIEVLIVLFLSTYSASAQTAVANDPTYIGVGARTLGMGKTYVGLSDDLLGIFSNPAALGYLNDWQVTTMAGKFINEYDYLNFGAAYPTKYGTFGVGLVSSSIGFYSPVVTTEVQDGIRFVPSSTEGTSFSYGNQTLLLSWGKPLKGLMDQKILDNVVAGATLKFYFARLTGPGIVGGNAYGNEVDLGLHYTPNSIFKAGMVLQNALPFTMGGKMKWDSGVEESFPALLKTGFSFKVLGRNGWRQLGEHELSYSFDYDYYPTQSSLPSLFHNGVEWSPIDFIDLRAGIDQDYVGTNNGTEIEFTNNLTLGVGLYYGRFRFDYAFHQYNQVAANDTHYFSITYGLDRGKPSIEAEAVRNFSIIPADKTIFYTQEVTVDGEVLNWLIRRVTVNSQEVAVADDGRFSLTMPLRFGKNPINFAGYDIKGRLLATEKIRILSLKGFVDVPVSYWAVFPIAFLAMENVITGYPDGTFRPAGNITRAEMATLLVKTTSSPDEFLSPQRKMVNELVTVGVVDVDKDFNVRVGLTRADYAKWLVKANDLSFPPVTEDVFSDVPQNHEFAPYIRSAVDAGLMVPMADGNFHPDQAISAEEEQKLVVSATGKEAPSAADEESFRDVPPDHWAAKYISKAVQLGLVNGYPDKTFKPQGNITRAEGTSVLARYAKLGEPRLLELPFMDIPGRHWAIKEVSAAKEAGLLGYLEGQRFEPDKQLTRAEVAEMVSKTSFFTDKIRRLLDWNIGY